jgi:hypothetical protein
MAISYCLRLSFFFLLIISLYSFLLRASAPEERQPLTDAQRRCRYSVPQRLDSQLH